MESTLNDLLAEADAILDEDARQEYLALRLEGMTKAAARKRCSLASHRSLLARSAPGAKGNGGATANSSLGVEDWMDENFATSVTMDERTEAEREHAWERQDLARGFVAGLDDRSRRIVSLRFGLDGEPMTPEAVAAEVGVSISTVDRTIQRARKAAQGDA